MTIDEVGGFVQNSLHSSSSSNSFLNAPTTDDSEGSSPSANGDSSSSSSSSSSNVVPPATGPVTAKCVQFRRHSVAGFDVNGIEMICLPQVYELFLKNMVGGLHTVYTKLRRLDIIPLICNVEQVRALRSLGAIQPGVNRCKLIRTCDFDRLYDDCTSTCTRPGRPSKRGAYEEWNGGGNGVGSGEMKKEKNEDEQQQQQNNVFNQLLPQLTTQQILMQHLVALAQKNSSNFDEGRRGEDDGTPLNLSKNGGNEENDSDSMESMRKEDSSPNNSVSDRGGSNSNSMSVEGGSRENTDDGPVLNKVMSLIEIASQQFKHEREELWKERNEIQLLRESFHKIVQEERDLRKKLEDQMRKCNVFERKYKFVSKQLLHARAEIRTNAEKLEELRRQQNS